MQDDPNTLTTLFKTGLRRLATTVSIITVNQDGSWGGMAATAVMPVCAEPPTLLVAINRSASIHPFVCRQRHFFVNLLATQHRELVSVFSGGAKGADRFKVGAWESGPGDIPILTDALARFECRALELADVSSHTLVTAFVENVDVVGEIDPLLWVDGGYASVWLAQADSGG